MKIFYIFDRFKHHSSYSGYDIFTRYIRLPSFSYKKKLFHRLLKKAINKEVLQKIKEIDLDWYKEESFYSEIDVLLRFSLYRNTIFHYLYGENSFRFSGYNPLKGNNKIVISFHQPPDIFRQVFRSKKYFKRIDAILTVGSNQDGLFADFISKDRIFYVPHGVDTEFFKPPENRSITKDCFECITVGWWQRDIEMLIKAIETINKESKFRVVFNIITFEYFFKHFQGLRNVRLSADITDDCLLKSYQEADLLLLPLKDCTTNNTVLEAMACGLPIISTQVGSLADYVDKRCSILIKTGEVRAMVDAIYSLFTDHQQRLSLSRAARRKSEDFNFRKIAPLYEEAYKKIYAL